MASDGARRFKAILAALPDAARRELGAELDRQADDLVALMKRRVSVRSGALRDSIRAERTKGRTLSVSIRAGGKATTRPVRKGQAATYDYALATELGNEHVAAQPFFYSSYRIRKKAVRDDLGAAVKKAVDGAVKTG